MWRSLTRWLTCLWRPRRRRGDRRPVLVAVRTLPAEPARPTGPVRPNRRRISTTVEEIEAHQRHGRGQRP
ncbi:MAG TPA: hypothetical protein DCS97_14370 [Planctomycetes bacterium]|nr:hypothetical protein [Planctomycetota bacterium]